MSEYEWEPGMRGIADGYADQGQPGGDEYEQACRVGFVAACRWNAEHPKADPQFHLPAESMFLVGAIEDVTLAANEEGAALEATISQAVAALGRGSASIMQVTWAIKLSLFVAVHGWDEFVRAMTTGPKATQPGGVS